MTDPTLGFDTRFARNLSLGNVPSAWVGSDANATAEFTYTVPPTESAHKVPDRPRVLVLAAGAAHRRLPAGPHLDRHVAQQNLNIVGQSQSFAFNLVHAPNARVRIELRALEPEELLGLRLGAS